MKADCKESISQTIHATASVKCEREHLTEWDDQRSEEEEIYHERYSYDRINLMPCKQQLQERKAMAFSQTQPQLIVHKILVQFQMLLNVDAGDRIIPALQNLITKLRISKMVLRKIRALFGLPQTTNNDEDLLEVIETYVRNLGIVQAERA